MTLVKHPFLSVEEEQARLRERAVSDLVAQTKVLFESRGIDASVFNESSIRWQLTTGNKSPLEIVNETLRIRPRRPFVDGHLGARQ